jgi:hypothetical protein
LSDISSSNFSETAASNNASPPNGWPEGQSASSVNDCARELMAAVKRTWNRDHATATVGGTANAVTLAYTSGPSAYVTGEQFAWKATAANTGAVTVNVSGLGAVALKKPGASGPAALAGGEIQVGQIVVMQYDGAAFVMTSPAANLGAGTVTSVSDATNGGVVVTNGTTTPAIALNVADLLIVVPAQSSTIPMESGAGTKKATWAGTGNSLVAAAQATVAQMQAETDGSTIVTPLRVRANRGVAKAVVKFAGATGAIAFNSGVSSVTRNGTGDYTVTFATSFTSVNYAYAISGERDAGHLFAFAGAASGGQAAGSLRIQVFDNSGAAFDAPSVCVTCWGDQ